jgi:hypothetical protein
MTCKSLNLRAVLVDNFGLRALQGRNEFRNVVYFGVVKNTGLDFLLHVRVFLSQVTQLLETYSKTQWFISIISAILEIGAILEFLFGGKSEQLLSNGELPIDGVLRQTKVDDVEKPYN